MENCLAHSLCSQSLVHCCNHCNPLFKSSVSKIADAVVYMVLIIFALNSFYVVMTYARETIQTMVDFILALLPILLALIATGGLYLYLSFIRLSFS